MIEVVWDGGSAPLPKGMESMDEWILPRDDAIPESYFFRDGHFECPLNRAKSCTLQVRAPLSLVLVESRFFTGLYRM
jgi:hypothetical protein